MLLLFSASCEKETDAKGKVRDVTTGTPIAGAHVMELAVTKNSGEVLDETYTDSNGVFYLDAGPTSFGGRRVNLQIFVEKDSYRVKLVENDHASLDIRLSPFPY